MPVTRKSLPGPACRSASRLAVAVNADGVSAGVSLGRIVAVVGAAVGSGVGVSAGTIAVGAGVAVGVAADAGPPIGSSGCNVTAADVAMGAAVSINACWVGSCSSATSRLAAANPIATLPMALRFHNQIGPKIHQKSSHKGIRSSQCTLPVSGASSLSNAWQSHPRRAWPRPATSGRTPGSCPPGSGPTAGGWRAPR